MPKIRKLKENNTYFYFRKKFDEIYTYCFS